MFDTDGPVAREISGLWWFMLVLGTAVFALFMVVLAIGLWRRHANDAATGPDPRSLRRLVLGGGVVLPTVVLTAVLIFTIASMRAIPAAAPPDALRVEVVGHRWWYEIRYPDQGVVTANELHLPVGRTVELAVSSDDVIHSFWVPALGGKLDMLPDRTNTMVLRADEVGEHRTQCAEFCGLQHAAMRLLTIVETEDDFDSWVAANRQGAVPPTDTERARGRDVFVSAGCASCHTIRGTDAVASDGPDLTHMASRRTIAAATVPLTRGSLREWITNPDKLKFGVEMPATALDDEEMDALLAYLEGLR